jgi:hypothetical protein
MSDHDNAPDPIDKAYVEAEAVLRDEERRAARRARVVAAVAQEPAAASPSAGRSAWRRGAWLTAASVGGLALFAVIYQPAPIQRPTAPTTAVAPPRVAAPASSSEPYAAIAARPPARGDRPAVVSPEPKVAPPPNRGGPVESPPIAMVTPPPQAFPIAPAPAPPPPPPPPPPPLAAPPVVAQAAPSTSSTDTSEVVVTAARRAQSPTRGKPVVAPFADKTESAAPDQAAKLRAAATDGRTADIEALLAKGVPVDAPDADGNTALMRSIQADHPAAAGLLRRHGASLDRKNHAGQSARDMATAIGDADLDQAIGLEP